MRDFNKIYMKTDHKVSFQLYRERRRFYTDDNDKFLNESGKEIFLNSIMNRQLNIQFISTGNMISQRYIDSFQRVYSINRKLVKVYSMTFIPIWKYQKYKRIVKALKIQKGEVEIKNYRLGVMSDYTRKLLRKYKIL